MAETLPNQVDSSAWEEPMKLVDHLSKKIAKITSFEVKGAAQREAREDIFERHYEMTAAVLGTGMSGAVKAAVHKKTGQKVAVKTFQIHELSLRGQADLSREISIQSSLHHARVAKITDVFQNEEHVDVVIERLEGGEVLDHLLEKQVLTERETINVVEQVLQALEHLHDRGVVHRDVKPENVLYESAARDKVKLIDFGLCSFWKEGKKHLKRRCGTEGYMAPEVFQGAYTSKADLWSVGVLAHSLLTGEMIGRNSDWTPRLSQNLSRCSMEAQKFVMALLTVDPAVRLAASQALGHGWIQDKDALYHSSSSAVTASTLDTDVAQPFWETDASWMTSVKFAEAQQSCDDSQEEPAARRTDATKPTEVKRSFWQKNFNLDLGATKKATALLSRVRGTKVGRVAPKI